MKVWRWYLSQPLKERRKPCMDVNDRQTHADPQLLMLHVLRRQQ